MICYYCLRGGEENTLGHYKRAANCHLKCEGDCPCQHKTGPGHIRRAGEKIEIVQTQSP